MALLPTKVTTVLQLAQALAVKHPAFFSLQGPGAGDRQTAAYIKELRASALAALGTDYAEHRLLPTTGARVDYWFPDEETVLEIAFGLRNPLSEFERDILKVVLARADGVAVSQLVLLSKPGAHGRLNAPWCRAVIRWTQRQGIHIHVHELSPLGRPSRAS